jgi:RNA polymerase sigma-70 factor, ECF subfamily
LKEEPVDERLLAEALARGESGAQEAAYKTYYADLYKTGVHILGHADPEAEDAVQEAFLSAFHNAAKFEYRGSGSLGAWLRRICVNECYNRWRQKDRMLVTQASEMEAYLRPKSGENAAGEMEKSDDQRALYEALGKLGDACRRMIELRDLKGESYAAISRALSIPMGTVMSRLYRCREGLKKLLRGND